MIEIHVDFDIELPFEKQLSDLLDGLPLTNKQWQTEPIIINLPALNYISAALIANLHGRMGYFPPILRLHLQPDSLQYKVAEIIYLQSVRNQGRKSRYIDKSESEP